MNRVLIAQVGSLVIALTGLVLMATAPDYTRAAAFFPVVILALYGLVDARLPVFVADKMAALVRALLRP